MIHNLLNVRHWQAFNSLHWSSILSDVIPHVLKIQRLHPCGVTFENEKQTPCLFSRPFSGLYHPVCSRCSKPDEINRLFFLAADKRLVDTGLYSVMDHPYINKKKGLRWTVQDYVRYQRQGAQYASVTLANIVLKFQSRQRLIDAIGDGINLEEYPIEDREKLATEIISRQYEIALQQSGLNVGDTLEVLRSQGLLPFPVRIPSKYKPSKQTANANKFSARAAKHRRSNYLYAKKQATGEIQLNVSEIQDIKAALVNSDGSLKPMTAQAIARKKQADKLAKTSLSEFKADLLAAYNATEK